MTIEEIKEKVAPVLEEYGVQYAGVFGSVARDKAGADSDIDLLVKFKQPVGLFHVMHFEEELKGKLQKSVDVVTEGGINKHLSPYIFKDLRIFYGQR